MPQGGMDALFGDPLKVLGYQYDLACNGYELLSGAIRNHRPEIMFKAFVDFPIYEKDDETGKVDFEHNPFSMPQGGMDALFGDPLKVLGYQYDLACNGYELLSGAIRNHRPEIMFKAFEIAGYGKDEVEKRFGGMVNAFQYGAPPHGGCAAGIDRIVMLLADEANIREVIMFPMNQRAEDLMMAAPSDPLNEQLRELSLRVVKPD
jgi:aspartyl-tRNA synthetase